MPRECGVLALAVAISACSSVKIQTQWDKAANFKGYRTYSWITLPPGPEQAPAARDPRVREAAIQSVDSALAAKGLTRVAPDQSPDLFVAVHGWATSYIDVTSYGYTYAAVPYAYGPMYMAAPVGVDVREYRDGTLLIDLVDAATHKLVWRGAATDTFSPGAEAETISNAIKKTLAYYPPPSS